MGSVLLGAGWGVQVCLSQEVQKWGTAFLVAFSSVMPTFPEQEASSPVQRIASPWCSVWAPLAAFHSVLVGLLKLKPLTGMDSELVLMHMGLFLKPWMFVIILSVNTCFLLVKGKH